MEKLKEQLPDGFESLELFLEESYPADIADFLSKLDEEEVKYIFREKLPREIWSEVISYLDHDLMYFLSRFFSESELSDILSDMHPDDAADFLGSMPVGKVKETLNLLRTNKASELKRLLGYDDESAGGLMTTEYLAFYSDQTAQQVLEKLREISPDAEMIYYIYVISRTKELVGVLSVRQLLAAQPDILLEEIMNNNVIKVSVNLDREEVAHIFAKYDLLALPVVNNKNQLMGIITVDDVIDVIEEEATEDIYKMAATADINVERNGLLSGVKKRIPWLLILLVGDLMSGTVIRNFETPLQQVVALAFFIPVLMDMGGNVGTQSLTVVVRGLATGELHFSRFWSHLWEELKVGIVMALILGSSLSVVALLWQDNPVLGLIVGISMFITLVTAIIAGTTIPFIMEAIGADPAVAAGPFITTLIDMSGLFIYFTLATLLMEKLL
ncbi:magnesium transporter [Halothermothrix orenii]|uniref:Magnesium transporter MgtE n=1 Tax=Halothermothrix orenii (strain H 168 / OCM 544 / DSM 9562) TaxID=373903 RepID=B8CXI1_HALOH|nr:magnesium transporter [Halothermothrix orenii]ACL70000.1 magnesium transporter [Halothermothrix orenii H 168]